MDVLNIDKIFTSNVIHESWLTDIEMEYITRDTQVHVVIEPATPDDIDDIVTVENRAYPYPWTRHVLLSEINGEAFSYFFVARLRNHTGAPGKIIGYHIFWIVADEIHILNIAVDPEYQGQGIGKHLLRFGIDFGRDLGAACVLLEVRVSNTQAQQVYRHFGFQQIGIRTQYYSDNKEDAYVMKMELST